MPLLVLLAVAAVSAVLFAKKAPPPSGPEAPRGDNRQALARRLPAPAAGAQHVPSSRDDSGLKVPIAATGATDPRAGAEFSASYGRSFNPASALFGPSGQWAAADEPSRPLAGPELETQADEPRSHVVVDGDTLTKLAARYLGSSDRFIELFHANRKVLSNPDLLPIGAVLEIPSAQPITGLQRVPAETGREARIDPQPGPPVPALVPVPKELLEGRDD